jgi:hypothetical protein
VWDVCGNWPKQQTDAAGKPLISLKVQARYIGGVPWGIRTPVTAMRRHNSRVLRYSPLFAIIRSTIRFFGTFLFFASRPLTGFGHTKLSAFIRDGTLKSVKVGGKRLANYASLKKLCGAE